MKNGRALTFILLTLMLMMSAILLQSVFSPKQPADEADQVAAANLDNDQEISGTENSGTETSGTDTPKTEAGNDQPNPVTSPGEQTPNAPTTNVESGEVETPVEPARAAKDEFVTIGSLSPDGADRFLVTINKRGGTIRRIELNFRKKNGRYKYRDIVWEGGYLGSLDCLDTDEGCQVRVVGKSTPAQIAGIEVGDMIVSINGIPVTSSEDFESYLDKKTKAGTSVEIVVSRKGEKQNLVATLTEKPIEIVRPEPGTVDPDFDYPESFVTALVKPQQDVAKAWPDLDNGMRDANWEVTEPHSPNEIELKFELSPSQLKALDIAGPLTVFKRYTIPPLPAEAINDLGTRTFHLNLELEVKNESDQTHKLAFELDGPTGTTAETWWYANKIHGRQTAIGYMAGARDIVGSTGSQSYVFYGCPEIVKGAQKDPAKIYYICSPFEEADDREMKFVGVDSHYFNVSLIPEMAEDAVFKCNSVTAYVNNRQGLIPDLAEKNVRLQKLVDCTFQLTASFEVAPGESYKQSFEVFCGPKEPSLLQEYGLSDVRTFGWFGWCSIVLLWILHFFYVITGSFSYGLAIIMLTVMVRCLMIPISRKAAINAQMMQHLQPQMKEIAEKYKDDMEKRGAAQRELYKKYNFNPAGGCFMMVFQLPIFYGLYKALNVDIALRDEPLIPGMQWCSNLAAPDQLFYWKNWMPEALAGETGWLGPYFNILPILTMILFIAQQKLFTPPATDDQQKLMQRMMTFMMVFMGIMFFKVPAGLCIYFITSSLWGIVERKLLPKPVLNTDNLVVDGSVNKPNKKLEKAKMLADAKRTSEAEARKQRNAERKKKLKQRGL